MVEPAIPIGSRYAGQNVFDLLDYKKGWRANFAHPSLSIDIIRSVNKQTGDLQTRGPSKSVDMRMLYTLAFRFPVNGTLHPLHIDIIASIFGGGVISQNSQNSKRRSEAYNVVHSLNLPPPTGRNSTESMALGSINSHGYGKIQGPGDVRERVTA
jgi:hypothetical protein